MVFWWRKYFSLILGFVSVAAILLAIATKPKAPPLMAQQAQIEAIPKIDSRDRDTRPFMSSLAQKTSDHNKPQSAIEKFVQMESLKIGRPDPNPQRSFQKLNAVAHALGNKDIEALKKSALDNDTNNDQRFLSVYLLSLAKPSTNIESALMEIAMSPIAISDKSSRLYAEELMMRTQALEGLAARQPRIGEGPLQNFLRSQDNTFLISQAERLLRERRKTTGN